MQFVPLRGPEDADTRTKLIRRIEASDARSAGAVLDFAIFCSHTGRQREAVPYLERLVASTRRDDVKANAILTMGQLMEQVEDWEAACRFYERGLEMDLMPARTAYFLRNNLGYSLNALGRYEEGARRCIEAIERDPRRANGYKNLGIALEGLGRPLQAAKVYLLATARDPGDRRALVHLDALLERNPGLLDGEPEIVQHLAACRRAVREAEKELH